jgi:hypothetical protein
MKLGSPQAWLAALMVAGIVLLSAPAPATAAPQPRPLFTVTALVDPETGAVIQVPEIASTITVPPESTELPTVFTFTAFYNEDIPNERGPARLPPGTLQPNKYLLVGSRVFTMSAVDVNGVVQPFFLNPIIIDTRVTDRDVALAQDIALNITLGRFDIGRRFWELEATQADTQSKTMRSFVSRPGVMAVLLKNIGVLPAPGVSLPTIPVGFPVLPATGTGIVATEAPFGMRVAGLGLVAASLVPGGLFLLRIRRRMAARP